MHGWRRSTGVLKSRLTAAALAGVASIVPAVLMAVTPPTVGAATTYLTITNPQLPPATIGQPYSAQLDASGGTAPYAFVVGGSYEGYATVLPAGLIVSSSGLVSGTPEEQNGLDQPVTNTFPIVVLDSSSPRQTTNGSVPVTITVSPPDYTPPPPLGITTTSLPEATINNSYSATMQASGGTPPYQWTAQGLPDGFAMSMDGTISGSSDIPSQSTITVTATDAGFSYKDPIFETDEQQQVTQQFTFTVSSGVAQLDPTFFALDLNGLLNDVLDLPGVVENEWITLQQDLGLPSNITVNSLLAYAENLLLNAIYNAVCVVDPTLKAFCGP